MLTLAPPSNACRNANPHKLGKVCIKALLFGAVLLLSALLLSAVNVQMRPSIARSNSTPESKTECKIRVRNQVGNRVSSAKYQMNEICAMIC